MKILLVGDFNSIYMYEYVRKVILDDWIQGNFTCLAMHFTNEDLKEDYADFYRAKGLELRTFPRWLRKIRSYRLALIIKTLALARSMKQYSEDDFLHIHYVRPEYKTFLRKFKGRVILTFWGSDLLRLSKRQASGLLPLLDQAEKIVVGPANMCDDFQEKFGQKYDCKLAHAIFGTPVLEVMRDLLPVDRRELKAELGIDPKKIVVSLGYSGSRYQQHDLMLTAIQNLPTNLKEKLYLLLPVAYGLDQAYEDHLLGLLGQLGIEYRVDENFYEGESLAKLRLLSDIFIHAQVTDGFSSSVVEYLYAGNVLLNANWNSYPLLQQMDVYYREFGNIDELTDLLADSIGKLPNLQARVIESRDQIYRLRAWDYVKDDWIGLYEQNTR